tara:strand:+ start:1364 stop:1756 length:393 start_codon:yes stop_codon:yes gene_type:complete
MRNMSGVPDDLHYTESHEWIRIEGDRAVVGITDYAQDALTDVVWVELAEVGAKVGAMEPCASVESVKSVSEIYAPVSGEIVESNEALEDTPEAINQDPYGEGWIFTLRMDDASQVEDLLDAATYTGLIGD